MKKAILIPALLLLAVCACEREAAQSAETEYSIPVHVEGLPLGTRVAIADGTGVGSWSPRDAVSLYVEGTGYSRYRSAVVIDNSVRLSLSADQGRAHYAIYPATSADPDHHTAADFRLTYPSSYSCGPYSAAELETWSPAPLVADNTADELYFYHVGGLLRLHVVDIPSGTKTFDITFRGIDNMAGSYAVSDPGTDTAAMTLVSGAGNVIRFTNLPADVSELTLNIPLPLQDYDGLTAISIAASGGAANLTVVRPVPGWGNLARRQGLYCSVDFYSICYKDGSFADGRFGPYYLSSGLLKWDAALDNGKGGYTLTDGMDPFEMLDYYGATEETSPSLDEILDVYYHQMTTGNSHSSTTSIRYRQDGEDAFGTLVNKYVVVDGETWRVPNRAEWDSFRTTRDGMPTYNGANTAWLRVLVDLTGSPAAGKGWMTDSGTVSSERTDYHMGFLFLPNDAVATGPVASGGFVRMTYNLLMKMLDGGCKFVPYAGKCDNGEWSGIDAVYYWGTDYQNGYNYLCYYILWGTNSYYPQTWNYWGRYFFPARLIHD